MRRTKIVDEEYEYGGFFGVASTCRVRIYTADGMPPVVLVSELEDNTGTSITNCAESLYPGLIARYLPGWLDQAEGLSLVEHYPGVERGRGRRSADTFDLVSFASWRPRIVYKEGRQFVTFGEPDWRYLGKEAFTAMVGEWE